MMVVSKIVMVLSTRAAPFACSFPEDPNKFWAEVGDVYDYIDWVVPRENSAFSERGSGHGVLPIDGDINAHGVDKQTSFGHDHPRRSALGLERILAKSDQSHVSRSAEQGTKWMTERGRDTLSSGQRRTLNYDQKSARKPPRLVTQGGHGSFRFGKGCVRQNVHDHNHDPLSAQGTERTIESGRGPHDCGEETKTTSERKPDIEHDKDQWRERGPGWMMDEGHGQHGVRTEEDPRCDHAHDQRSEGGSERMMSNDGHGRANHGQGRVPLPRSPLFVPSLPRPLPSSLDSLPSLPPSIPSVVPSVPLLPSLSLRHPQ
eukprot:TRINITY_DN13789_c0_g1_i1.p1 TRINITY_DN13789_c0_g1~~TRINITY_DN13789_c0_g1_i1.p1  ORF type:complete len:316 (-),score=9.17 TRINITY_DN13789_c0_g1_i1:159-1106(-)